jgi:hypothetical protein
VRLQSVYSVSGSPSVGESDIVKPWYASKPRQRAIAVPVLGQAALNHGVERPDLRRVFGQMIFALQQGHEDLLLRPPAKRTRPRERLDHHHADREDVRSLAMPPAPSGATIP